MTETSNRKEAFKNNASFTANIQLVLLGLYYLDICHSDHKEKCTTVVPYWDLWVVWLPTIMSVGLTLFYLLLACLCGGCTKFFKNKKNEKRTGLLSEVST